MSETTGAVQKAKEPETSQLAAKTPEAAAARLDLIFQDIARRAFEIFDGNGREFGHDLENWFKAEQELVRPVNIELTEHEGTFEIKAEVPGFTEKELEINVEPRQIIIAGKHETTTEEKRKGKVVCSDTCAEHLLRVVELPGPVETGKVTATLQRNGVLTLILPKVVPAQPVRIKPVAPG